MLSKFFVITVFVTKCDKKTSYTLFAPLLKIFVTKFDKKRKFHEFQNNYYKVSQKIMAKCGRFYKVGRIYYKVWQVLQKVTRYYYKVWRVLQSLTVITKWDVPTLDTLFPKFLLTCTLCTLHTETATGGVLKNIHKDHMKNLSHSLFFIKLQLQTEAWNFIKKKLWHRCFPVNFAKFLRTSSFFTEHLQAIVSVRYILKCLNELSWASSINVLKSRKPNEEMLVF